MNLNIANKKLKFVRIGDDGLPETEINTIMKVEAVNEVLRFTSLGKFLSLRMVHSRMKLIKQGQPRILKFSLSLTT